MTTYSIRYWKDGNGHWLEVRDAKRNLVASAWNHGSKDVAIADARHIIARLGRVELAQVAA